VRSLDATDGLDDEAIQAARQWEFVPGAVDGRPAAVLVWIELTFAIGKK
jgi:hypothetical protein